MPSSQSTKTKQTNLTPALRALFRLPKKPKQIEIPTGLRALFKLPKEPKAKTGHRATKAVKQPATIVTHTLDTNTIIQAYTEYIEMPVVQLEMPVVQIQTPRTEFEVITYQVEMPEIQIEIPEIQPEESIEQSECYVCMTFVGKLVETCGQSTHMVCDNCVSQLRQKCPMCRSPFKNYKQPAQQKITYRDAVTFSDLFRTEVLERHFDRLFHLYRIIVCTTVSNERAQMRACNTYTSLIENIYAYGSTATTYRGLGFLYMLYQAFIEQQQECNCLEHRAKIIDMHQWCLAGELSDICGKRVAQYKIRQLIYNQEFRSHLVTSQQNPTYAHEWSE